MSAPDTDAEEPRSAARTIGLWFASIIGGGALLWLASLRIELWPDDIAGHIARPELLIAAIALYVPYAIVRAFRLRYALDPIVEGPRVPPSVLYGSGWVSFLVILMLPFRLGEVSRPVLLARPGIPGLGLAEAVSAIATERVVDGLLVVALLFVGLGLTAPAEFAPGVTQQVADVQTFGRGMTLVFAAALIALIVAARAPAMVSRVLGRAPRLFGSLTGRLAAVVERLAAAIRPLGRLSHGGPFMAWSLVYWAITVVQLWLVLHACGLPLGLPAAATIVAVVGLSIQLPGGPAQAGSFQVGTALGLGLFVNAAALEGPGSSFAAIMYALGIGGAVVFALPGAYLLSRPRAEDPARSQSI